MLSTSYAKFQSIITCSLRRNKYHITSELCSVFVLKRTKGTETAVVSILLLSPKTIRNLFHRFLLINDNIYKKDALK